MKLLAVALGVLLALAGTLLVAAPFAVLEFGRSLLSAAVLYIAAAVTHYFRWRALMGRASLARIGKLLGTCALWGINVECRRAEIGYILGSWFWGQGYIHEALSALLDYSFTELNLNRLEADTDSRNQRSARLLDRLNFSKEGLFRERCIVDGEVSDSAMYGLLRHEWNPKS